MRSGWLNLQIAPNATLSIGMKCIARRIFALATFHLRTAIGFGLASQRGGGPASGRWAVEST
jgi:hypothetical protein